MPMELEERLALIESRLATVENHLGIATAPPALIATNEPAEHITVLPESQAEKPGNWLGLVAIICFVLAGGFIVKLSIESGWLTPARQIGLAVLFGFSLIGAGFTLLKTDREYASLLPNAGIIILYLAAFASHSYYTLIPFEAVLVSVSLVSILSIWLYTHIKHTIYVLTAAIGAYLSPVILGIHANEQFSLCYFLLCSITFTTLSIWLESRILIRISAYLALIMSAVIGLDLHQDVLLSNVLALHFLFFTVGTYLYSTEHHSPLTLREAGSFLPILVIFYLIEYHVIDRLRPGLAPWASLGFAALLLGTYLAAKHHFRQHLASQSVVLAFITLVCFHSVYLELLPAIIRPWLLVAVIVGCAFVPFSLTSLMATLKQNRAFYIPSLAVLAICGMEYSSMLSHLATAGNPSVLFVAFAAFLSLWMLIIKTGNLLKYDSLLLIITHLLTIMGCYRITASISSLAVSASWLFYAVSVMALAFKLKNETMAKSALLVLALAAGKALLYDAAAAPTIVRIFCLLLTGIVLYGCGLLMRKITGWKKNGLEGI